MAAPSKTKSTKDVVAFARELCDIAARIINPDSDQHDPFAKPYAPSDDTAYKLVSQMGVEGAYGELVHRAREANRANDARKSEDAAKQRKLRHQRAEFARDQDALMQGLSYGQRVDRALSALAVVSEGETASLNGMGGGDPQPVLSMRPTDASHAASIIARAVRQLEDLLEQAVRRTLRAPDEDRDDRLRRLVKSGLNASQISIADRTQGTVKQITERINLMLEADSKEAAA